MHILKFIGVAMLLPLIILGFEVSAQAPGKISGRVIDKKTADELIGVAVMIKGTSQGSATDISGNFLIENVAPGTYTLVFTYVSYQKKELAGVVVKSGQVTTVNTNLEESTEELTEVVVQAEVRKESLNSLLIQQKNSISIGNGISAETIKQTPDNNTGEVMKRISGATIQNGRFAIIRGLNDRYNAAMINGSPLPSTEPERRAFSFDMIPANMLDQLIVVKTATPDLPGDFAGGVIQVITKETPDMPFMSFKVGAGYNTLTTFRTFKTYQGSSTDWLGFDNGVRKLPDNFPTQQQLRDPSNFVTAQNEVAAAKMVNNNYEILEKTALPNMGFEVSGGKTYGLGKDKTQKLGVIFSLGYTNSNSFTPVKRAWYDNARDPQFTYADSMYENSTRIGALLNFSYKFNNNNKITFKNIFNLNGEDITATRIGPSQAEGIYKRGYSYFFTQNLMALTQLNGEHYLENSKLKVTWELSNGYINRQLPDYKNTEYRGGAPEDLELAVRVNANENAARLWTELEENVKSAGASVSGNLVLFPRVLQKNTWKVGLFHQDKNREFVGRMMGFAQAWVQTFNQNLLTLPINEVFSYDNFYVSRTDSSGFKLNDITNPSHVYSAGSQLTASYFMLDHKIGARWKLIWGVRYEMYKQQMISATRNGLPVDINVPFNDPLPSVNLVYSLNTKSNLRASYSQTVSRPELRELAPFAFYDFSTFSSLEGNANLQRTKIKNYDLRYETYPGEGQVFSFALFYKEFNNPIELLLANDISLGVVRRTFYNLPSATSLGAEVDFRYNLTKRWTAYGNLSLIQSVINMGGNPNSWNEKRPMQGQSPYILNAGILYRIPQQDLTLSLLYNQYGDRIFNVGNTGFPDVYEKARPLVDFQVSKFFMNKKFEAKAAITDILAQDLIFYMDFSRTEKFDPEKGDEAIFRFTMPRIITMSFAYRM